MTWLLVAVVLALIALSIMSIRVTGEAIAWVVGMVTATFLLLLCRRLFEGVR